MTIRRPWTLSGAFAVGLIALLAGIGSAPAQTVDPGQAGMIDPRPLAFDASNVGPPRSGKAAEYFRPPGAGPFPAVVVLHGCSGVSGHTRLWARRMAEWGYAALLVDSFRPRGVENVCNRAGVVSPRMRAGDAFAAAGYLRGLPEIDAGRIAILGFSHGGSTALVTSTRTAADRLGGPPFKAVVSFYPWCPRDGAPLASDTLVLIGGDDDWTPAPRCEALAASWKPEHGQFRVKVYPGAKHSFDSAAPERIYFGHRLGPDPVATSDAIEETRRFLKERFAR